MRYLERRSELVSALPGPEEKASHHQDLHCCGARWPTARRQARNPGPSRFQGMKYEDIAEVLGCEVGTVKVRVYRAIRALEQIYFALEKEKAHDM